MRVALLVTLLQEGARFADVVEHFLAVHLVDVHDHLRTICQVLQDLHLVMALFDVLDKLLLFVFGCLEHPFRCLVPVLRAVHVAEGLRLLDFVLEFFKLDELLIVKLGLYCLF